MQAVVLAAAADPEKERTIGKWRCPPAFIVCYAQSSIFTGVLTKPDMLTKGATGGREKWKAVLEGREHPATHGYYCVRLLDDEERARKISSAEAQRNAATFFDNTAPWDKMADRSRFGIPNFVSNISALLVERIEKKCAVLFAVVTLY